MRILANLLYAIDNGLLNLYYKTKFRPFEKIGAGIGWFGNKINKKIK